MPKPLVPISVEEIPFKIEIIEGLLRSSENIVSRAEFPPKIYKTKKGEVVLFRQAKKEEAPIILKALKPLIDPQYDRDFYHLVATRTYAEVLAWAQGRYKDEYVIIGTQGNELIGVWNARFWDENLVISLHSISFKRLGGIGVAGYVAKLEHAFDILGAKEWWATFESPFGFRLGMYFAHRGKAYPEYQHELGGSAVWYITKDMWEEQKKREELKPFFGERPAPEDLLKESYKLQPPSKYEIEM